jgi:hypothetical protein
LKKAGGEILDAPDEGLKTGPGKAFKISKKVHG